MRLVIGLAVCALLACGSLLEVGEDAPAGAVDAAVADTAPLPDAVAPRPPCPPSATFCDDFEKTVAWTDTSTDPGASMEIVENGTYRSPTHALLTTVPATSSPSSALRGVNLGPVLPGTWRASLRVSTPATAVVAAMDVLSVYRHPGAAGGNTSFNVALVAGQMLRLYAQKGDGTYPQTTEIPLAYGAWMELALEVDFATGKAILSIDGVVRALLGGVAFAAPNAADTPYLQGRVGVRSDDGNTPAMQVMVDDVSFEPVR